MNIFCRFGIHNWSNWADLKINIADAKPAYSVSGQQTICLWCNCKKTRYV